MVGTRSGECCRQVEAEEVSNSRKKFTKPGNSLIEIPCKLTLLPIRDRA